MGAEALATFDELKPLLFSIACRMLGSVVDEEDIVQETFIRWQNCEPAKVESPKAWLSTVITRLCINHLKSARVQREMCVGPWLPEPSVAGLGGDPGERDLSKTHFRRDGPRPCAQEQGHGREDARRY